MIKDIVKLDIIAFIQGNIRGAVHSICNLKHSAPKEIPMVFHSGSNYDYRIIIKELAEKFEKAIYLFRRKH